MARAGELSGAAGMALAATGAEASVRSPMIFVSAGDTSGDDHAAALVRALRERIPAARFLGFGGAALRAEGVELLEPLAEHPVMGFAAVLPALGRFVGYLSRADRLFASSPPDLVIAVDYPGFNVRLARLARRRSIRTAYYICPQYWGWAPWRARRFAQAVDLALTILPFEAEFLARHGISAKYVGHPLADRLATARPAGPDARALALLPGSRRQEIEHVLPWQLRAARRLLETTGATIPLISTHPRAPARERITAAARAAGVELEVRDQPLPELLAECRAAIVTSGTATLECALLRVPSVIVYRTSVFMKWASGFVLTTPWIGLPNLLSGATVFPEYLAAEDPGAPLAEDISRLWRDGPARDDCLKALDRLRQRVLNPGAAVKAADAIAALELIVRADRQS